jgi:hypothetical protein
MMDIADVAIQMGGTMEGCYRPAQTFKTSNMQDSKDKLDFTY